MRAFDDKLRDDALTEDSSATCASYPGSCRVEYNDKHPVKLAGPLTRGTMEELHADSPN